MDNKKVKKIITPKILEKFDEDKNGTIEIDELQKMVDAFREFTDVEGAANGDAIEEEADAGPQFMPEEGKVEKVRRLSDFLNNGATGFEEEDLAPQESRREPKAEDMIKYLKTIGVDLKKKK